ncbi:MAG: hypothetical protein WDM96_09695 [Lacunisphaera sp.]
MSPDSQARKSPHWAPSWPSVADNVISVELRGSELADSPLQRDGPLRGQTVTVDLRRHGPWDPTLNNGQGGYTWVGTPLGDTSGWVGLTTHTVAQLSIDGGSVRARRRRSRGGGIHCKDRRLRRVDRLSGWHRSDDEAGIWGATSTTSRPLRPTAITPGFCRAP